MIRDRVGVRAGRVGDGDPEFTAFVERDVVKTRAVLADDLKMRAFFKHFFGQSIDANNQSVIIGQSFFEFLLIEVLYP